MKTKSFDSLKRQTDRHVVDDGDVGVGSGEGELPVGVGVGELKYQGDEGEDRFDPDVFWQRKRKEGRGRNKDKSARRDERGGLSFPPERRLTKNATLESEIGVRIRTIHLVDEDGDGERVEGWRATVEEDEERSFAAEIGDQERAVGKNENMNKVNTVFNSCM